MRIEYGWLTKPALLPLIPPNKLLFLDFGVSFFVHSSPLLPFWWPTLPVCVIYHSGHNPLFLTSPLSNNWMITIMITKNHSHVSISAHSIIPDIWGCLLLFPAFNMYLASTIVTILFFWYVFSTTVLIPITVQQSLLWSPGIHSHVCLTPPTGSSLTSTCFCHLRFFAPIYQCASCYCCTGFWLVFFIYHSIVTFPVPLIMIYLEMCIVSSGSHDTI